jgi:predicted RNA-binding protein
MAETGYWIIVGPTENFDKTRALGFTVQGMKSRHRKKAEQMKPGDKLIYYLTGIKAFGGIVTVTSNYFEDHDIIWRSTNKKRQEEDYPFRVRIESDVVLDPGGYIPAEPIARAMTYVQRWPADNWTLAFQGNVHHIDEPDYDLIRRAITEAATTAAAD